MKLISVHIKRLLLFALFYFM